MGSDVTRRGRSWVGFMEFTLWCPLRVAPPSSSTTAMAEALIALLPRFRKRGSALDMGCGCGGLAVLAAKLGFAPVSAVDILPTAVDATRISAEANGTLVHSYVSDVWSNVTGSFDLILANLPLIADRIGSPHQFDHGWRVHESFFSGLVRYLTEDGAALVCTSPTMQAADHVWELTEREGLSIIDKWARRLPAATARHPDKTHVFEVLFLGHG